LVLTKTVSVTDGVKEYQTEFFVPPQKGGSSVADVAPVVSMVAE